MYKLPGHQGSVNDVDFHPKEPICKCMGVCVYVYVCVCMHACMCAHACAYVYMWYFISNCL